MSRTLSLDLCLLWLFAFGCASGSPQPDAGPPPPPPPTDAGGGCLTGEFACGEGCVDPMTDPEHCGACDHACAPAEICRDGACVSPCPAGTPLLCGDRCVDPTVDDAHCGACDHACGPVESCVDGACASDCAEPTPSQCGDVCVDFDTDEEHCGGCFRPCGAGEVCLAGSCQPPCDPGLVYCGGACVDPSTDETYCGASGDCTGARAGTTCTGGEVCVGGVCDATPPRSCADALSSGRSTGDGVYRVDPDGPGPGAPMDVYCDMTTDGGGWTLTYKVKSDIPQNTNPWWNMVMPGAGTTFPTAPAPPSGSSEGPTLATRASYTTATGATEWRATTLRAGMIVFDVASTYTSTGGQALRCFAAGTCARADQTCSGSVSDGRVLANTLGGPIAAGGTGFLCDVGWTDCSFCADWSSVRADGSAGGSLSASVRYVGDSSIGLTDATTLYWVR